MKGYKDTKADNLFKDRNTDFDELMSKSFNLTKLGDKAKFEKYYPNNKNYPKVDLFKSLNDHGIRQRRNIMGNYRLFKQIAKDIGDKPLSHFVTPRRVKNLILDKLNPMGEAVDWTNIYKLHKQISAFEKQNLLKYADDIPKQPSFKDFNIFETNKSLLSW